MLASQLLTKGWDKLGRRADEQLCWTRKEGVWRRLRAEPTPGKSGRADRDLPAALDQVPGYRTP